MAKYYTPSGKAIQDVAITPNILVADKQDDFVLPDEDEGEQKNEPLKKEPKTGPDDQLNRAIQVLKNNAQRAENAPAPVDASKQ